MFDNLKRWWTRLFQYKPMPYTLDWIREKADQEWEDDEETTI